jgi:peptide/nickel transport system substrate-binding protein
MMRCPNLHRWISLLTIGLLACGLVPGTQQTPGVREELRIAIASLGTEALDPLKGPNNNAVYLRLMFDALVGVDPSGTQISKDSGIAQDWKITDGYKTYTFNLRRGVKFQNGDEVTAEDVKFTLERLGSPQDLTTYGRTIAGNIEAVTVLDPYTVQVRLKQPGTTLLYLLSPLADVSNLVVPKRYFDSVGDEGFAQTPMGSGPYKFVRRQTGSFIELEQASNSHWLIGKPRFKRVVMRLVTDESSRVAMLRSGDADFIDVGVEKAQEVKQAGFNVLPYSAPGVLQVMFNLANPNAPTRDINVRKALSYAINRQSLNDFLWYGEAPPLGNPFPSQLGGQPIPPDPYDVAQAEQFLGQTAYRSGGQPLTIELNAQVRSAVPQMQQIAQAIQADWRKIGVQSEIVFGDYGTWRAKHVAKQEAPNMAELLDVPGRSDWYGQSVFWFGCNGLLSMSCDPELDKLNESWGAAADEQIYAQRAVEVEKYVHDQYYTIPLLNVPILYAANDQVRSDYSVGAVSIGFDSVGLVRNPGG